MAQLYHPDKNPKGRDIFVRVNQAYEFLCARTAMTDGPSPSNIVLILRTQSILFDRYAEELRPYKYAGYPQLIKTIRLETKDEQLFSKSVPLLSAAAELCYHTVHCSALNAEELRREEGIEALLEAYSRCVSIMGVDSKPESLHYQVISNITMCFEVACNFENCKKKILELPQLVVDVCRVVYFKHSLSVGLVTSLAANNLDLQCNLVKNGVLWSLLLFMFDYDYTLDESGVATDEKSNNQKVANNLAKLAILACVSLAGYEMTNLAKPKISQTPPPPPIQQKPNNTANSNYQGGTNLALRSTYNTQARNLLQEKSKGNFKSYVEEKVDDSVAEEALPEEEKKAEAAEDERKYAISGQAENVVVKKILDKLVTPFVANKFSTDPDRDVLKMLTSNTRNPYLIWDNGTRAQLIDFLEYQRTTSSKEQYEDITDIYSIVEGFSFDAHK